MFLKTPANTGVDTAISRVLLALEESKPGSNEYDHLLDQLTKLNEIKACNAKARLSNDTLATIGAHLAGILLILQYERVNLVGTKALAFVQKLR